MKSDRVRKQVVDNPTVLVVEDDLDMLELLQEILSHSGYCVITAANVQDGIHMLETMTFCVVVTDLHLPDGNGNQILAHIRETEAIHTQVILCTGMELLPSLNHHDYDDYLTKPVCPDLLTDTVAACLETRGANIRREKVA